MAINRFRTSKRGSSVGILTLGFLVWYTIETCRLRKAAQKQIEVSQNLLKAANDQAEGSSKQCLCC
jgi:hypothetical protein